MDKVPHCQTCQYLYTVLMGNIVQIMNCLEDIKNIYEQKKRFKICLKHLTEMTKHTNFQRSVVYNMRENMLLAKAKRIDNGEWVTGYYRMFEHDIVHSIYPNGESMSTHKATWHLIDTQDGMEYEVDPETICECTGVKDKNDIFIFENDIVECVSWNQFWSRNGEPFEPLRRKMQVVFKDGAFKLKEEFNEYTGVLSPNYWDMIVDGDLKIVGSIFDTKDGEEDT